MPVPAGPDRTVPALVERLARGDASRPLVTWLDVGSGSRVELSVATVANWVAKIGGLLQDGLDLEAGDRVRLALPAHWLAVPWALGCWTVGAVVEGADCATGDPPAVEVFGADRSPVTTGRPVVVALGPFGGPVPGGPPSGALDSGAEVLGHPDELWVPDPPGPSSPALVRAGSVLDHAGMLAAARELADRLGVGTGDRLLTTTVPATADGLLETVLVPLVTAGSVVLVSGGAPDRAALAALADRERADVVRVTA